MFVKPEYFLYQVFKDKTQDITHPKDLLSEKNSFLLKLGNNFSEVAAKDRENCHVRISIQCF